VSAHTVAFATLGCRLNQVDSQQLQTALESRGFRTVPVEAQADVVVVNSCTVTGRAEFSDRQAIRRAARVSPGARIVVTGCWAQTNPGEVASLDEVDLIVGNADKATLPDLVEGLLAGVTARVHVSDVAQAGPLAIPPTARVDGRSRAFLKAQDGCQHRCAFCIVPHARGRSRSLEPKVVLDHARRLLGAGHRELVLTGVDLGHYGADLVPRTTLTALLRELCALPRLRWVRLSSLLPAYFTEELLEVVTGSPVVAPHLHIPLQSGSDRVLRRMRRPYTVGMYRRLVERLAAAIPGLGVGTDVIVGFPGETEGDFLQTRSLVEELPFSYLHVFAYSARRGTEAAGFQGRVASGVASRRSSELRDLGREKNAAFRERLVGSVQDVVVLDARDRTTGGLVGLTGNFVEVVFPGPDRCVRTIVPVRIDHAQRHRTVGGMV